VFTSISTKTANLVNGLYSFEFFDTIDFSGIANGTFSNGSYVAFATYTNITNTYNLFMTVIGSTNKAYV